MLAQKQKIMQLASPTYCRRTMRKVDTTKIDSKTEQELTVRSVKSELSNKL